MREKYLVFTGRSNAGKSIIKKVIDVATVSNLEQPGVLGNTLLSGGLSLIDNEIDKARGEEMAITLEEFMHQVSGGHPQVIEDYIFPVSAKTGEGLGALKSAIHRRLVMKGLRRPSSYVS